MPQFNGMSVKQYKKALDKACLDYLNDYRKQLGLEPVSSLRSDK